MKVAAVQMSGVPGDVQGNLERIAFFAGEGARAGCRLLLFPEISDLGYDLDVVARKGADHWEQVRRFLAETARSAGLCLVCGVCLPGAAGTANALVAFGPDGTVLASYRKLHLFQGGGADEFGVFVPGDEIVTFDLEGVRFGMSICFDLRFPELFRAQALRGCHALLLASAWPRARIDLWRPMCLSRAVENQCCLLGANRVGEEGAFPFGGESLFVGPTGDATAADGLQEGLVFGTVDAAEIASIRAAIPALARRRPELYADLTS